MSPRGWAVLAVALALAVGLGWWSFRQGFDAPVAPGAPRPPLADAPAPPPPPATPAPKLTAEQRQKILRDAPEAHLADDLNLPGRDIRSDLALLASVFGAWRSNFPGQGNPFGDNREITGKLLGGNPNGIIFLQPGHRALNRDGELCDRWGTPFHFHAESGTRMEIRSAGPDRRFRTEDDATIVP